MGSGGGGFPSAVRTEHAECCSTGAGCAARVPDWPPPLLPPQQHSPCLVSPEGAAARSGSPGSGLPLLLEQGWGVKMEPNNLSSDPGHHGCPLARDPHPRSVEPWEPRSRPSVRCLDPER